MHFFNKNHNVLIQISLEFVPEGLIKNKSALVQVVVAWCQTGDKPLPESMLNKIYDAKWLHLASMS